MGWHHHSWPIKARRTRSLHVQAYLGFWVFTAVCLAFENWKGLLKGGLLHALLIMCVFNFMMLFRSGEWERCRIPQRALKLEGCVGGSGVEMERWMEGRRKTGYWGGDRNEQAPALSWNTGPLILTSVSEERPGKESRPTLSPELREKSIIWQLEKFSNWSPFQDHLMYPMSAFQMERMRGGVLWLVGCPSLDICVSLEGGLRLSPILTGACIQGPLFLRRIFTSPSAKERWRI